MDPRRLCLLLLLALTFILPVSPASEEVWQFPNYVATPEGSSISITCSSRGPLSRVYLYREWPSPRGPVVYYEDGKMPTVDLLFSTRTNLSWSQHNLTIIFHHLRPADTGLYTCEAILSHKISGPGTLVVVTDKPSHKEDSCQKDWARALGLPVALAVGSLLVGLGLGATCALKKTQIKKLCLGTDRHTAFVVYEDMSFSRHNTLSIPNQYQ